MLLRYIFLTVLSYGLFQVVTGYMIDGDCGQDTQFVQDRVDAAFRSIANAATEIQKKPVDPNVDNLFYTIFGERLNSADPQYFLNRFQRLQAISQFSNTDLTQDGQIGVATNDVRFYCTTNRITKNKNGDYINKDRGNLAYEDPQIKSRWAHCYDVNPPTLMITMTFDVTDKGHSEIQICPWFLRKSRGFKIRDLKDIDQPFYAILSQVAIPASVAIWYTPIDAFLLMDKVLVHELMHTTQAYPAAKDVGDAKGYGFRNVRALAQSFVAGQVGTGDEPRNNADSLAIFVSGTWIINNSGGTPINADGSFTRPTGTPKVRRRIAGHA